MVGSVEFQVTGDRVCVLPSVNAPIAVNCVVVPRAIEELVEFTAIDTRLAGSTVKLAEPVIKPEVALMVTVPTASVDARPELSTEAIVESDELQVANQVLGISIIEYPGRGERLAYTQRRRTRVWRNQNGNESWRDHIQAAGTVNGS